MPRASAAGAPAHARARRPGWTVAPSANSTPPARNTGEAQRRCTSFAVSARTLSETPRRCAARDIASGSFISCAGAAETRRLGALAPPEITAAALRKGVQAVLGTGTGPRHGECPVGAEQAFHAAEGGPVAVDPCRRSCRWRRRRRCRLRSPHDDIEVGPALLEGEGGPEPGVTAADDGDIGGRLPRHRSGGHAGTSPSAAQRLREPPRSLRRLRRNRT